MEPSRAYIYNRMSGSSDSSRRKIPTRPARGPCLTGLARAKVVGTAVQFRGEAAGGSEARLLPKFSPLVFLCGFFNRPKEQEAIAHGLINRVFTSKEGFFPSSVFIREGRGRAARWCYGKPLHL